MHGQHHRLLQEEHIGQKTSLTWMKDSRLKGHTEAMVHAIQDQAVKIRYIEKNIYKTTENESVESVTRKQKPYTILQAGAQNMRIRYIFKDTTMWQNTYI